MKYYILTIAGVVLVSVSHKLADLPDMLWASFVVGLIGGSLPGHVAAVAADH